MDDESLMLALTGFAVLRTPGKLTQFMQERGCAGLRELWSGMDLEARGSVLDEAHALSGDGIGVILLGDESYPRSLVQQGRPVTPVLFHRGNLGLLEAPGVGMCGSRSVSELGLKAARAWGVEVTERGLVVVSGYAKGVDTETHLAALATGGSTVIVLAEGFKHFRIKKAFSSQFDFARTLVVSQFPPSQPWGAYAAMARNKIIYGLGHALVVIEAGERGGTLAAGEGALRLGKPVFVLNFGSETPPGNLKLLRQGGRPVESRGQLGEALDTLIRRSPTQGSLPHLTSALRVHRPKDAEHMAALRLIADVEHHVVHRRANLF